VHGAALCWPFRRLRLGDNPTLDPSWVKIQNGWSRRSAPAWLKPIRKQDAQRVKRLKEVGVNK
jgi:hypothetical protein